MVPSNFQNEFWTFGICLQDGDQGDDDQDEDAPRAADMEGRVEKYIGVKVKACSPYLCFLMSKIMWLVLYDMEISFKWICYGQLHGLLFCYSAWEVDKRIFLNSGSLLCFTELTINLVSGIVIIECFLSWPYYDRFLLPGKARHSQ